MNTILAIETSTDACSVALHCAGEVLTRSAVEPRKHAELVLHFIDELMSESELQLSSLDALGFGCGPGSFTGVRIATAVVQGLAFGANLPVVPVSTLAALAHGAAKSSEHEFVAVTLDARMNEVYYGAYRVSGEGLVTLLADERVSPLAAIEVPLEHATAWLAAGPGWAAYEAEMSAAWDGAIAARADAQLPDAQDVLALAMRAVANCQTVAVDQIAPVYLRNRVTR